MKFKIGDWVEHQYEKNKISNIFQIDGITNLRWENGGSQPIYNCKIWEPKEGE